MSKLPILLPYLAAAKEDTTFHDLTMIIAVMVSASDVTSNEFVYANYTSHH
jgi:hypothetical protein